jgi:PAS domain S-box-containing protein
VAVSLRTRTIIWSLVPLLIVLLLAVPEGILQWRASTDQVQARRAQLASAAARDIGDGRVLMLIALRRYLRHDPTARIEYVLASGNMRAAVSRLKVFAGPERTSIELAQHVILYAATVLRDCDDIETKIRGGRVRDGRVLMTRPVYLDDAERLQDSVRAFIAVGRTVQQTQFTTFQRLWNTSILLLALAVAGLVISSVLLLHFSGRAVRGIQASREHQLERYRLLADITQDLILFIDRADLTIIDVNAATLKAYGYERSHLIGQSLQLLKRNDDTIDPAMLELTDTATGAVFEMVHQRSDGTTFPVEIYCRGADLDGRRTLIMTARDITERRHAAEQVATALEQSVEALRIKGEFVATMSHEIRTPMHGVIAMSELLLDRPLGPVEREYAATLKESAQALLSIINDILDFSKLEANKIELEAVPFDPAQVVKGVVNLVRAAAGNKGLVLLSHASPNVPGAVRGDPVRLRQILMNLVGNAVKFTPNGGAVTVSTSVSREGARSVDLLFTVNDTGIGVPEKDRERLFDAFVQGDGSTTRRFGGTGLGLTISRRLVEIMRGRIWLGEHEGPGSTFCFTVRFERATDHALPIRLSGLPDAIEPIYRTRRAGPSESLGRARILLAEDSALVRRVARFQLEDLRYAVDIVEDGKQAVTAVATCNYELVFMDMRMPEMDGLTATRVIRLAERGSGRHVIIVALTANALEGDRAACIDAGMDDFLAKPLQLDALRAALERWLPKATGASF